jgi:hypothetical protein
LNRLKNDFSQLLKVRGVSDIRQMEVHAVELLVPESSPFEVEISIAKLKRGERSQALIKFRQN